MWDEITYSFQNFNDVCDYLAVLELRLKLLVNRVLCGM